MNFQEAVKYMRETGKTVVVIHGLARGKEYVRFLPIEKWEKQHETTSKKKV